MKNLKHKYSTCVTDSKLCKQCDIEYIKNHNQACVLLCFSCANCGATEVKSETKDFIYIKALHPLWAEI